MIEAIAIIAVLGLVASNLALVFIVYRTKLLEKSKDIFEYKAATKTVTPPKKPDPVEVPLY